MSTNNEIVLFESSDGTVTLPVEVDAAAGDVWLTRNQMALLFDRDVKTIGKHIGNALEEELDGTDNRTVAKFATVQTEGSRTVTREVEHYSLDVIISVGYRVKSQRGVEFRRWATDVLHRYVVDGVAANQRRLDQLDRAVRVMARLGQGDLAASQILDIVQSYMPAYRMLDDYDHGAIARPKGTRAAYVLTYEECRRVIDGMGFSQESDLFGREKDDSFRSSVAAVYQGFGGQDIYPSVEEKAANLLYLIVKNHSFVDGNKRIAACLFVYFLDRCGLLVRDGRNAVPNELLVAITIMIAESRPDEKEAMVSLVMNFL